MGRGQGPVEIGRIEGLPLLVVVGPRSIGDAPLSHGAGWVVPGRLTKAAHGLLVIVAVAPQQSAIEPELRTGGSGGHLAAVAAEVVVVGHRSRSRSPRRAPAF